MITDAYTVQFLLEGTVASPPRVVWRESAGAGLAAHAGEVDMDLTQNHDRTGTRIRLSLRQGADTFSLHEPLNRGWLNRRYATEDEELLAVLMTKLWRAASAQLGVPAEPEAARDRLYRQLLFESSS